MRMRSLFVAPLFVMAVMTDRGCLGRVALVLPSRAASAVLSSSRRQPTDPAKKDKIGHLRHGECRGYADCVREIRCRTPTEHDCFWLPQSHHLAAGCQGGSRASWVRQQGVCAKPDHESRTGTTTFGGQNPSTARSLGSATFSSGFPPSRPPFVLFASKHRGRVPTRC